MKRGLFIIISLALLLLLSPTAAYAKTDTRTVDITVDLTPPEISITGVEEGGIYSSPVSPDISIVDNNGEVVSGISLKRLGNPMAWSSGQPISDYGNYILTINATDKAGNITIKTIRFSLATAGTPMISINKQTYTTGETMTVTVDDLNRTGKGLIQAIAYGVTDNPTIELKETEPGKFVGQHTFKKGILSGGFYVRYLYDSINNKYVEASGFYSIAGGVGTGDTTNNKPSDNINLPGEIISVVEDPVIPGASQDTAVFRKDGDQYIYVPTIYENGRHKVLSNEKGQYILIKLPKAAGSIAWANPARKWFEQRGISPQTPGDAMTIQEAAKITAGASGITSTANMGGGPLTTPQMEQIIISTLNSSPVGKCVFDQRQVNRWAQERRTLSKPLSKDELMVTLYWFLQNANIAK